MSHSIFAELSAQWFADYDRLAYWVARRWVVRLLAYRSRFPSSDELAELAQGTGLRSFSYRSAFVRPTSENANLLHYLGEALLKPGALVITGKELGRSMLEISARTSELPNGTVIDNADSIAYARAYEAGQ